MSYGERLDELAAAVLYRLRSLGLRLAVAESCSGGDVLAVLTRAPGATEVVWGGAVVYSAAAKRELVDVDDALIHEEGVVSEPVTRALADGIRRRAGVDVGAAVTGWAGPTSDGPDPVGTVYVGVAAPGETRVERREIPGARDAVRAGAVAELLVLILQVLESEGAHGEGA